MQVRIYQSIICLVIVVLCLTIVFRHYSQHPSSQHLLTIKPQSVITSQLYSGVIQPLSTQVITCPADGVIMEMPFQYGEWVRSGQLVFMLSSTKFLSDYKEALTTYLKAKSEFSQSKTLLDEALFLHKNGLISDDDFKSKQTNFYAAQLTLLQTKDVLEHIIQQFGIKNNQVYQLSIADIDQITQAMHLDKNVDYLRIISFTDGILLSSNLNADENKKLDVGDQVKQGDVLAMIGNMKGIKVRIKVNELIVNQLKLGQKIFITGMAFPDEKIKGSIYRINRQGETANGGLPSFAIDVTAMLSNAQQKQIHVGMSAKVEIVMDDAPQLMVPINALQEKNGNFYATLYHAKMKNESVFVTTGKTTQDSVAVLTGLKAGDQIVVSD